MAIYDSEHPNLLQILGYQIFWDLGSVFTLRTSSLTTAIVRDGSTLQNSRISTSSGGFLKLTYFHNEKAHTIIISDEANPDLSSDILSSSY